MFSTYQVRKSTTLVGLMALVMVVVLAACQAVVAQPVSEVPAADANVLTVEVAEDHSRFVFSGGQLFDDGMPQYGTPFVTQGYIYPAGTLNGSNGVLEDGSPEFPDKVIGEWTCRGWMVGDGMHTTTGNVVVTTQIFQFDEGYAGATVISDGFELADIDVPVERAITGGTGLLRNSAGKQVQTLKGMTDYMGVVLSVDLHLQ